MSLVLIYEVFFFNDKFYILDCKTTTIITTNHDKDILEANFRNINNSSTR